MPNRTRLGRFVCIYIALMMLTPLVFGADAWIGTWKLNPAKSKFSPGPAPKGQTVTFSAVEGGKTKVTVDVTDADGKITRSAYVSMFDGKDVRWSGNPNADTAAAKKIDEFSYENQSKKGGKPTLLAKVTVSKDSKTLTVIQTGTDAQGKMVKNTAVYDKQ